MEKADIYHQLEKIFVEVLDLPIVQLKPTTSAKDIAEWDSLNHIRLISQIEKEFKVELTQTEIQEIPDVGAMVELLLRKT